MFQQAHSGVHFRSKSGLRSRPEQADALLTNESFIEYLQCCPVACQNPIPFSYQLQLLLTMK